MYTGITGKMVSGIRIGGFLKEIGNSPSKKYQPVQYWSCQRAPGGRTPQGSFQAPITHFSGITDTVSRKNDTIGGGNACFSP